MHFNQRWGTLIPTRSSNDLDLLILHIGKFGTAPLASEPNQAVNVLINTLCNYTAISQ